MAKISENLRKSLKALQSTIDELLTLDDIQENEGTFLIIALIRKPEDEEGRMAALGWGDPDEVSLAMLNWIAENSSFSLAEVRAEDFEAVTNQKKGGDAYAEALDLLNPVTPSKH